MLLSITIHILLVPRGIAPSNHRTAKVPLYPQGPPRQRASPAIGYMTVLVRASRPGRDHPWHGSNACSTQRLARTVMHPPQFRSRPEAEIRSTKSETNPKYHGPKRCRQPGICMSLRVAAPRCGWCQEETKTSVLGGIAQGSALDDGSMEYGKPSPAFAGAGSAGGRPWRCHPAYLPWFLLPTTRSSCATRNAMFGI